MDTFPKLIDELGGPTAVATAVNEYPGLVRQWKFRGNIPPAYWPKLIEFAKEKGVDGVNESTLAKLAIDADQRRAPPKASQPEAA